jgi:transposase
VIDESKRTTILELHRLGHGTRAIAKAVEVARSTVREVIATGSREVPPMQRAELAEPYREQILELYARYQGHLRRVHKELVRKGAQLSYSALTAFTRKHGIGSEPKPPAESYSFAQAS